jgi:hypothetical protein
MDHLHFHFNQAMNTLSSFQQLQLVKGFPFVQKKKNKMGSLSLSLSLGVNLNHNAEKKVSFSCYFQQRQA